MLNSYSPRVHGQPSALKVQGLAQKYYDSQVGPL